VVTGNEIFETALGEEEKICLVTQKPDPAKEVHRLISKVDIKIQEERDGKHKAMVPYGKLVWTLADKGDRFYFICGLISAAVCGLGLPSFVFLFGDIADSFEGGGELKPDEILTKITRVSLILSIIGTGVWVGSYLFFAFLTIASERLGLKTRVAYLRAILRQEIAWFDSTNPQELCQRLSTES
jgi:ATP-binding cassette subfamily B (MDR/TAP) protein 1